jgi:hypothetical protein
VRVPLVDGEDGPEVDHVVEAKLDLFYAAFTAFRDVVDGMFGRILADNWPELILIFQDKYKPLGLTTTTKVR